MNRIRSKTRDAAFQFRMGAGFAGDVNRTHPASIEQALNDATNPVTLAGLACVVNTAANSVRQMEAGDTALTTVYGVTVRAFPFQQQAATNFGTAAFGAAALPGAGSIIDVLRRGYIMVQIPVGVAVTKGGAVWVWVAASTGNHVQGGFEGANSGGNVAVMAGDILFNGPADATGIVELSFKV